MTRRHVLALATAIISTFCIAAPAALAGPETDVALFKVVTVKDEIVIGLTGAQLAQIDGRDAPGIARALKAQGVLDVWRYTVAKGVTGELLNVPLARVGLMTDGLVRIEPMHTPLAIVPPNPKAE